jgi:4-hydroxybenzoate polyprenyltransferase
LIGWSLAVSGFSLDFCADREIDKKAPRTTNRNNPIANDQISVKNGLIFSISFMIASLILLLYLISISYGSWWGLIWWGIIVMVLFGLAFHRFETPLSRAGTLGILQLLYFYMGATVGSYSLSIGLVGLMFFFAMFGGRGVTDIRDFPLDQNTPVQTLPKKYGMKKTAQITAICLSIAYLISLGIYFTHEFNFIYLILDIIFIITGIIITILFLRNPNPQLAKNITMIYMMGQGTLICLAVILGSIIL